MGNSKQEPVERGQPDDREPTPERQAELEAAYEANVAAGWAPYAGVRIRTLGELRWIMHERRWSGEFQLSNGYERATLSKANLYGATLSGASLAHATLSEAHLSDATLNGATLIGADLSGADLARAILSKTFLSSADLSGATLIGADLSGAHLSDATLSRADLRGADLSGADFERANLSGAGLARADLSGADLARADLSGADLGAARMDATTQLRDTHLDTYTLLADVVWNGVPLTRLNWQDVVMLGDEQVARDAKDRNGKRKGKTRRLEDYDDAVLANRQVATALRSQGLNEHADRFAYRAQLCQRRVLRLQRHYLRYLGSLFLGLISGYGYRPLRSVATYVLVVLAFAGAYLLNAQFAAPHLSWDEALVLSISAFHGRGFFTSGISLGDTLARLAAGEAIIGLLIEITFIATFTQRFFAR